MAETCFTLALPLRSLSHPAHNLTFFPRRISNPFQTKPYHQKPFSMQTPSKPSIVIAGGSGFIGQRLCTSLTRDNIPVTILTRNIQRTRDKVGESVKVVGWSGDVDDGDSSWEKCLEDAGGVVNLCGEPVVSRWSEKGKERMWNSRVLCTRKLVRGLENVKGGVGGGRRKVLVSASGVGYYGTSEMSVFDESCGNGEDFLAKLCVDWENAAKSSSGGVRSVVLRFGVVLGKGGGAISRMLPIFKLGFGGPILPGSQWVSFIHVDDLVGLIRMACEDDKMEGVFNATAPNPITMNVFSESMAKQVKRPNLVPVPAFAMQLLFGQGAQVVTEGQKVIPKRALDAGYKFKYPKIDQALKSIVSET